MIQEHHFFKPTVKEGGRGPFIALEPMSVLPVAFAPGLLTLTLRDGVTMAQATELAAVLHKYVLAITHVPKSAA